MEITFAVGQTATNNTYVPLPDKCKRNILSLKCVLVKLKDAVSRAKHFASLHLLALLIRQRHIAKRCAQLHAGLNQKVQATFADQCFWLDLKEL